MYELISAFGTQKFYIFLEIQFILEYYTPKIALITKFHKLFQCLDSVQD